LVAVAARTGQLLNYNNLANDVHIDSRTAKLWLSILERSGIIQLLYPYSRNITKSPKIYFLGTGLASYLAGWDSPQSLMNGAQSGSMLETFVFVEILKSYWHWGDEPRIYFYRDEQKKIDFLIEQNMTLYPMEVKKTAMPNAGDTANFKTMEKLGKKPEPGRYFACIRKLQSCPGRTILQFRFGKYKGCLKY
jgi:predicted AAA+ superfamily ATPase